MLTRLLINWPYKIAALAIAIALHGYVAHLNDPHVTKQINVALTLSHIPDALVVSDYTPDIAITAGGPASSLDTIGPTSYTATVDLRTAHAGVNQPLVISLIPAAGTSQDVNIETQSPRMASVTLENKVRARYTIRVSFRRIAPTGLSYGKPTVEPHDAMVEGPESLMNRVASLIVFGDDAVGGDAQSQGTLEGLGNVVAMDAQNIPVSGVNVMPEQAEVSVPVVQEAASKDLIVNAAIAGSPAYPAEVTGVDIEPNRITVVGPPGTLAQTSVVDTAPVDVTGASGDVRRVVAINLPAGLTQAHPTTATVTVHIKAGQTSTSPSKAIPSPQTTSLKT